MTDLTRRLGQFRLPQEWLRDRRTDDMLAALDGCIVTRAETVYHHDAIEYVAIHPQFDAIAQGSEIPRYRAIIAGGKRVWLPEMHHG